MSKSSAEYDRILEIRFTTPELQETIEGLLYLLDSEGSVSEEQGGEFVVRAFFASDDARHAAYERFAEFDDITLSSFDVERVDWLDRYQQSLHAIEVAERFVVAPDESLVAGKSGIPIVIPQERAFGTGSHETTWLCLKRMETAKIEGKRCVDIGTGSGILAIGMHKLGARKVIAFDNDIETWGTVGSNLARNGVSTVDVPEFYGGPEALRDDAFDFATMNIIPEVIIPLLPDVRRALRSGATILFSGILNIRRDDVVSAAQANGFELSGEESRGEWWCGEFLAV